MWQNHPPNFAEHVDWLHGAYFWAVWDQGATNQVRLVEVYFDDMRGFLVRWDGVRFSENPEDYDLWWPEPVEPPAL